ncbi:hypothetical protein [Ectobacillus funiculus]|uniref:hypothetical protein n=1 Tax=Ectobacillus funiculus TaxID=137993 RepID=UPI00101B73B0|nr:hypothetical protein [Ectobacillus funiculus]
MKKWFLIGALVVVVIFGAFIGVKVHQTNQQKAEFYTFREQLDERFFPLLKENQQYFDDLTKHNNGLSLMDWNVKEGIDTRLKLQKEVKEIREEINNTDLKYQDTLELKQNAINSLALMEEIYRNVELFGNMDGFDLFVQQLPEEINALSENIEKQNKIMSKYYK